MKPLIITAFYTKNSVPTTTLSPTIKIRKVSNSELVINDAVMTSIGEGQYVYSFSLTEPNETYTIVCDGGGTLANSERYNYATCETPAIELIASFSE
jgi:hypothetical protein